VPVSVDGRRLTPLPGGSLFNSIARRLGRHRIPGRLSTDFFGDLLSTPWPATRRPAACEANHRSRRSLRSQPGSGEPQYAFFSNGAADPCIAEHDLPPASTMR